MMVKQLWQKRAKIMLEKLTVVELNEKICTRVFNGYSIDMQDSESLVGTCQGVKSSVET